MKSRKHLEFAFVAVAALGAEQPGTTPCSSAVWLESGSAQTSDKLLPGRATT
jgi:hypothetical protein